MNHLINSFFYHSSKAGSRGLYPSYKPDQNHLIKSIGEILFYIAKLFSLPAKILFRKNFGYRYLIPLDCILYLVILTTLVGYLSVWTIVLPALLIYDLSDNPLAWLMHFPILSWCFVIWMAVLIFRRLKKEINLPIDKLPMHSCYPGQSKLVSESLQSKTPVSLDHIHKKIEPLLCSTVGLLIFPIDYILAIILFLMAISLRIEAWHDNREYKMAILDLTDSLIDNIFHQWMYEKFQKCAENKIPVEDIYKLITTQDRHIINHKLRHQKGYSEFKNISPYKKLRIDKLLNDLL